MRSVKCPNCDDGGLIVAVEAEQSLTEVVGIVLDDNGNYLDFEPGTKVDSFWGEPEFRCNDCMTLFTDLKQILGDEDDDSDSDAGTSSYRAID